jgi:Zn finger protein HypA/HybF involved in hydrogenase expression
MDSTPKALKAALEAIRDIALNALDQIEQPQETRSMRWECKECRYMKHFTRPVPLEAAGRCPRCKVRRLILFLRRLPRVRLVIFDALPRALRSVAAPSGVMN